MRVRLKHNLIVITAETEEERAMLSPWVSRFDEQVFVLKLQDDKTFLLKALEQRPEACRETINVTSKVSSPEIRLRSNLALTPLVLDGQEYTRFETFWQGLKFPNKAGTRVISQMHGQKVRRAGLEAEE